MLLKSVNLTAFRKAFRDETPLFMHKAVPKRAIANWQSKKFDAILSQQKLTPGNFRISHQGLPFFNKQLVNAKGIIAREIVANYFENHCTTVFEFLEEIDRDSKRYCTEIAKWTDQSVHLNAYLTPPNSKGFSCHFDLHDVLVIQVSGSKKWKLWEKPVKPPLPFENFDQLTIKKQKLLRESSFQTFDLKPGDALYFPRGFLHEVETQTEGSIHLTFGIEYPSYYTQFLKSNSNKPVESLTFAMRHKEKMRQRKDSSNGHLEVLFKNQTKKTIYPETIKWLHSSLTQNCGKAEKTSVFDHFSFNEVNGESRIFLRAQNIQSAHFWEHQLIVKKVASELIFTRFELQAIERLARSKNLKVKEIIPNNLNKSIEFARKLQQHRLAKVLTK